MDEGAAEARGIEQMKDDEEDSRMKMPETMKEIAIQDIASVRIGQAEDPEGGTGCTVLICEDGMCAGLDIRGGGPASRDTHLLDPQAAAQIIHGIVLGGGSAFGLGAANGVMQYLQEHDIGFDVAVTKVPLVCQSDLFDLTVADVSARPDAAMGYEAARRAMEEPNYKDGNFGAGCGATVGKLCGMETCMKTGIGSYAVQIGSLQIGAIVALNALGDVYDWETSEKIAGLLTEDKQGFRDTVEILMQNIESVENRFTEHAAEADGAGGSAAPGTGGTTGGPAPGADGFVGNTTLGVVITNGAFTKSQLCKIASMAHNGYARSIRPVHTTADGDSIYAVSAGQVDADQDLVGTLAAEVMSEAIKRAVFSADSAYGFLAAKDLKLNK